MICTSAPLKGFLVCRLVSEYPVPVAQFVERWTPCGGSTRPGYKSPPRGFEARRALDIYEPPDEYGCGWCQTAARRSREGDRSWALRGYVRTLKI